MPTNEHRGPATAPVSDRVARLEALEAVRTVILRSGQLLDEGDIHGYADCFCVDARFTAPMGSAVGREAIVQLRSEAARPRGPAFHVITSPVITLTGDTATAHAIWFFVTPDDREQPAARQIGMYHDELRLEGSEWKLHHRTVTRDIG